MLVNQGDAEVQPWNLHLKEPYLYYSGQFSSINDCLYRFLWSSKYVLHGDVDELFISFGNKSLNSLLDDQFSQVSLLWIVYTWMLESCQLYVSVNCVETL